MNIRIVDSHLREFLKTKATPKEIAKNLSLTSVSVEKVEKAGEDFVYDIEVTTNRPDLMSVVGIAREASVILPEFGINATFISPKYQKPNPLGNMDIEIKNDPRLVHRISAAILEVKIGQSPEYIRSRLEKSGIRSLNNLIDVTNYIMREIGHPAHVFDYDKLGSGMVISESKPGEVIETLDGKRFSLPGGDIVASSGDGKIVDLLGIMGLRNSVVGEGTKRILLFLNNNDPARIRKTSMSLGIRTEAAVLNEKGVDSSLAIEALYRGIDLYEKIAEGKLVSQIIDIYPNKLQIKAIKISFEKIDSVIGAVIPPQKSVNILKRLGFEVKENKEGLLVTPPTFRAMDVSREEDLIEEIARVYGYSQIPSLLPPLTQAFLFHMSQNPFYWEMRVKNAMKFWGFSEVYTYSMVSEELFEGMPEDGLKIANPISKDLLYMRRTLVPSLLSVVKGNKSQDNMKIFELSNIYEKQSLELPNETLKLAGLVRGGVSFFEIKGIIESLFSDLGIKNVSFRKRADGEIGADVEIYRKKVGDIEVLEDNLINFELDFDEMLKHVSLNKKYNPIAKYPPIVEDLSASFNESIPTQEIIDTIKKIDILVTEVNLLDQFKEKRTFHIIYQDLSKNLSNLEVSEIREKIKKKLSEMYNAKF